MKNKLIEKILLLFLGFLLTTACGTLLGSYLQGRSWENQWTIKKVEIDIEQKKEIFQHISSLMDKRLYRMRQFLWSLQERFSIGDIEARRVDYREILYDWNENLNKNFALIEIHFGKDLRDVFEFEIGSKFISIGEKIESLYWKRLNGEKVVIKELDDKLNSLHIAIYHFNLKILERIQQKLASKH